MPRLLVRKAVVALSIALVYSQGSALAYVTDQNVYSPVNYFTFLPPEAGQNYIDLAFGAAIKRMSNALTTPHAADAGNLIAIVNEYSTMSPFNSDNSKILVEHRSYFALYDGNGNYLRDLPFEIGTPSEPRWSRRDPNVLYYHAVYGNQLKQYDVGTGVSSVVHTFNEYTTVKAFGESDISFDGDHFVLAGDGQYIFVYEISTDSKGPVLDTGGRGFDSLYITPDNNVTVTWWQHGTARYNGIELFDRNMNFLRQLTRAGGHMDVTRDVDGTEVLVWASAGDPQPICNNGVVKIRLADGQQTCLLSFDWSLAFHVSAPDGNGRVIVSTYAWSDPDPLTGWRPYTNEILQVKLDGSEVVRLLQHRSRPLNSYYYQPRAAVSRDGSKVIYSSNYGLQTILGAPSAYSDVYLIDLASAAQGTAGSIDSVATRFEQDGPAIAYACPLYSSWYTSTYAILSGGSAALAMNLGCQATFSFTGSAVSWIGYRDQWAGIADVYVDDVLKATVDTYAAPAQVQAVLFSASGLGAGNHRLTLQVTETRNAASAGSWVWVDAFDVVNRLEQDDPAVTYIGTWLPNSNALLYSGGSAALGTDPDARATFTFTGTAVSWIGYPDQWSGIAQVYIDGALRAEIDTYAPSGTAQARLYTLSGLPPGPHTFVIAVAGRSNPASGGIGVWVDAFESRP